MKQPDPAGVYASDDDKGCSTAETRGEDLSTDRR